MLGELHKSQGTPCLIVSPFSRLFTPRYLRFGVQNSVVRRDPVSVPLYIVLDEGILFSTQSEKTVAVLILLQKVEVVT